MILSHFTAFAAPAHRRKHENAEATSEGKQGQHKYYLASLGLLRVGGVFWGAVVDCKDSEVGFSSDGALADVMKRLVAWIIKPLLIPKQVNHGTILIPPLPIIRLTNPPIIILILHPVIPRPHPISPLFFQSYPIRFLIVYRNQIFHFFFFGFVLERGEMAAPFDASFFS